MFQQTEVDRARKDDSGGKSCRLFASDSKRTVLALWEKGRGHKNHPLIRVTFTADHGPLDSTDDTAEFAETLAKTQQWDRTF